MMYVTHNLQHYVVHGTLLLLKNRAIRKYYETIRKHIDHKMAIRGIISLLRNAHKIKFLEVTHGSNDFQGY